MVNTAQEAWEMTGKRTHSQKASWQAEEGNSLERARPISGGQGKVGCRIPEMLLMGRQQATKFKLAIWHHSEKFQRVHVHVYLHI